MADVEQLVLSYPDFVLNTAMNPDEFDQNNAELTAKINELVVKVNADITDLVTNFYTKANIDAKVDLLEAAIGEAAVGEIPDYSIAEIKLSRDINVGLVYRVRW